MTEISEKLQAALNHDWLEPDEDFPASYIAACREWFAALSASDKAVVAVARATFDKDDEPVVLKIAAALPAAPKFPQ